jgi:hypothetical protein
MSSQLSNAQSIDHPFQSSKSLLVVIPNDAIDVEEESRLYDELCGVILHVQKKALTCYQLIFFFLSQDDNDDDTRYIRPKNTVPRSPKQTPSVFSNDIWLGDNIGESSAFARNVEIRGWTNVGDQLGGAYVGTLLR